MSKPSEVFEQAYDNFLAGVDIDTTMLDCAEFMFNAGREGVGKGEPVAWQFFQDGKWHNGMDTKNHRTNTEAAGFPTRDLYTHPAPAVAQEPVVRRTLGYEQGIQDAAKMLDTKADDYAKEFGFDDMGALEFSRETQREYHSTLIELAEEIRSMETTNPAPAVCQTCNGNGRIGGPSYYAPDEGGVLCPDCNHPPAEVVRELVEALEALALENGRNTGWEDFPNEMERANRALKSAKEHGL